MGTEALVSSWLSVAGELALATVLGLRLLGITGALVTRAPDVLSVLEEILV